MCAVNTLQLTVDEASIVQLRVICIADKPYKLASLYHYRHDAAGSECRIVCRVERRDESLENLLLPVTVYICSVLEIINK